MHNMRINTRGTYILVGEYKYNLKYLDKDFWVRVNVNNCLKSTRNQVTGYELTSPLWLRVDFPGTG